MSIADSASVKMPPGPQESPVPARSFATICSIRSGSSPIVSAAEFVDRDAQAAGHLAAVEGHADALDAVVGAQAQDDDRTRAAGFLRHVGQRIVFRNAQGGRFDSW